MKFAAQSIVLLKNDSHVLLLPLPGASGDETIKNDTFNPVRKLAVIGPNTEARVVSGGGSANLKASYFITPYEGVVKAVEECEKDVKVEYEEGVRGELHELSLKHG
jgi:beta-glucosidase